MDTLTAKQWFGSLDGQCQIQTLIDDSPDLSRSAVARGLCEHLDWRDALGRLKEMACRKALVALERLGKIILPEPRLAKPDSCQAPVPPLTCPEVTGNLSDLGLVEVLPISGGTEESRTWNALMEAHHPLGSGPLCGAQIRYLIVSEKWGMVGCLAVSAAAWRLSARDEWLGWDDATRGNNLSGIVCNSRFLILPSVQVKNLASHVLGQLARRIGKDWQERYGYSPWLMETCVDTSLPGTVYRAANWIEVGMTAGRGRQDTSGKVSLPKKRVFLYPLCQMTLKQLCGCHRGRAEPGWVYREFGGAELGDKRLERRLLELATSFFARPMASIPEACGSHASTKAAYRFFDHEQTTMDKLLEPHRKATIDRMRHEPLVLVVQDSSSLNYTTHRAMQGIGPIGTKVNGPQGLMLHNTLAFRPDGLPLGILNIKPWARDPEKFGIKNDPKMPIKEKESYKWIQALSPIRDAAVKCPNTKVIVTADRESDIYDFLVSAEEQKLDVLIRAKESRLLDESEQRLWPYMETLAEVGRMDLSVPRHDKVPARMAQMGLRFAEVTLTPPKNKANLPPLRVWAVWSKEISVPPEGTKSLEWMLLTTVPVRSANDAVERIQWYARRWGIEVFHRILKSGCCIEDRQLGTDDRLEACLAIDMVVAWRIHYLTYLGRATPDVPCTVAFDDTEWKAVLVFETGKPAPEQPPTLGRMILSIAKLGGFLGRKSDGFPGTETIWKGLDRMQDIAIAFKRFMEAYRTRPP